MCALGHLPLKGKAFGRLIAAPTNRGERSQNWAGGPGVPPLRVERFSHSGRPQGSPLRRFSAAIQNGASRRPRPTKGESLQSGRVRTPAPTADAEASCPFVGAGHWPARGRDTPQGGFSRPSADSHSAPPLRIRKKTFQTWVGEPLGAPAVNYSGPKVTLIRLAYARHLLPGREKAFGRLIAAPTNRGERF